MDYTLWDMTQGNQNIKKRVDNQLAKQEALEERFFPAHTQTRPYYRQNQIKCTEQLAELG